MKIKKVFLFKTYDLNRKSYWEHQLKHPIITNENLFKEQKENYKTQLIRLNFFIYIF